jgi:hypothetical protein
MNVYAQNGSCALHTAFRGPHGVSPYSTYKNLAKTAFPATALSQVSLVSSTACDVARRLKSKDEKTTRRHSIVMVAVVQMMTARSSQAEKIEDPTEYPGL